MMQNDMIQDNIQKDTIPFKQNRELSWLTFNNRILEEANDNSIPILERLKFVAIYTSNLDEFFMIRVGSLYDKSIYTPMAKDNKSGLTPKEQLDNIYSTVHVLNERFNNSYKSVEAVLRSNFISSLSFPELDIDEKKFLEYYYKETIYPLLSPQIVDPHHPFPHLNNKSLYIASLLKHKDKTIFGVVPIPEKLPSVVFLPGQNYRYIHIEKLYLNLLITFLELIKCLKRLVFV